MRKIILFGGGEVPAVTGLKIAVARSFDSLLEVMFDLQRGPGPFIFCDLIRRITAFAQVDPVLPVLVVRIARVA